MGVFTLTYGGVEKEFPAWGLGLQDPMLEFVSMGIDTFTVKEPGRSPVQDPLFPDFAAIVIQANRSGSFGSYGGGSIVFQGKREKNPSYGGGRDQYHQYHFKNAWWDMESTIFQQTCTMWSGSSPSAVYTSDLILMQGVVAGKKYTNGQQLTEIVNYAATCGIAVQAASYFVPTSTLHAAALADTGGAPKVDSPTYQVKDMSIAEAIKMTLRMSPDAVVWFDYSTTPPTLNCKTRGNLGATSLAVANGIDHKEIRITPRYDLQVPGVILKFQQTNTLNNQSYLQIVLDIWPYGTPETTPFALLQTINLQGGTATTTSADVTTAALPAAADSSATRLAFWKQFYPVLDDAKTDPSSIVLGDPVFTDETGATYTVTGLSYLQDGQLSSWIQPGGSALTQQRVTIKASCSYDYYNDGAAAAAHGPVAKRTHQITNQTLSHNLIVTNAGNGDGSSHTYTATASVTSGDPVPLNLAQSIYTALATLQYEGSHSLVEQQVTFQIGIGKVLNLTGGRTEWSTMNALVQSVRCDLFRGETEITFGPATHLSAGDMITLFQMNRYRMVYRNPSVQSSGQTGSGGQAVLGKNMPKENTTPGVPQLGVSQVQYFDGTNNITVVHDPALTIKDGSGTPVPYGEWFMGKIISSTGLLDTTTPSAIIKLSDILAAESAHPQLKVRAVGGGGVLCTPGFTGGGTVNWQGDYNHSTTYNPGDLVRMTTGTTPGIYIQKTGSTCSGQDPFFNAVSPSAYWVLFAFTPYDFTVCVGGASKTTHMNATAPA